MAGVRLRDDFDGGTVGTVANTAKDGPQVRRLLALAAHLRRSGKMFEWADIDDAPRLYVEKNVQRERRSVASDCYAPAMKGNKGNTATTATGQKRRSG